MGESAADLNSNRMKGKGPEARRTPRRIFRRPVGVLLRGRFAVEPAIQLSEGGLLFLSSVPMKTDMQIVTSILLPSGEAIVSRAEVVHARPSSQRGIFEVAVRFINISIPLRRLIRNYVSAKTQEETDLEINAYDFV